MLLELSESEGGGGAREKDEDRDDTDLRRGELEENLQVERAGGWVGLGWG